MVATELIPWQLAPEMVVIRLYSCTPGAILADAL